MGAQLPDLNDIVDDNMLGELEMIADAYSVDVACIIDFFLRSGINNEGFRFSVSADLQTLSFPPHTPPFKNNINNNNTEGIINKLNLNSITKSNPIVSGKSPLEAKAEAKKKRKRKNKTSMPLPWRVDRENETISDQVLIEYAEEHGYDWYVAKELFLAFVDYHLAKGSTFVKWENAFYTWVRNDRKFNGSPAKKTGSVIHSFKKTNPLEDLFNE